jgi:hypothetical protein
MPPLDKPPMSPDVAQQQPGGAPPMPGMQQAADQSKSDPIEMAVKTCEKLLMGINDPTFKPYAVKAVAQLKIGLGMAKQGQAQSGGAMSPPPGGAGAPPPPQIPTPPMPGQMPV